MGNPHAVCFVDDFLSLSDGLFADPASKGLRTFVVARVGVFFESHRLFAEKSNIEFAVIQANNIVMRVFERGCGETKGCSKPYVASRKQCCIVYSSSTGYGMMSDKGDHARIAPE